MKSIRFDFIVYFLYVILVLHHSTYWMVQQFNCSNIFIIMIPRYLCMIQMNIRIIVMNTEQNVIKG